MRSGFKCEPYLEMIAEFAKVDMAALFDDAWEMGIFSGSPNGDIQKSESGKILFRYDAGKARMVPAIESVGMALI